MAPGSGEGGAHFEDSGSEMSAREHAPESQAGNNGFHEAPSASEREPRAAAPAHEYHAEPREPAAPQAAPLAHFEPSPRPEGAAPENKPYVVCPPRRPRSPRAGTARKSPEARSRRAGLLAQMRQQAPRGSFHQVEDLLEAVGPAVVGIGHLGGVRVGRELHEEAQPLVRGIRRAPLQHRRFSWSIARIRSKRVKSAGSTTRARRLCRS